MQSIGVHERCVVNSLDLILSCALTLTIVGHSQQLILRAACALRVCMYGSTDS